MSDHVKQTIIENLQESFLYLDREITEYDVYRECRKTMEFYDEDPEDIDEEICDEILDEVTEYIRDQKEMARENRYIEYDDSRWRNR